VNFKFVTVGIEKVGLTAIKHAVTAVFDVEYFDTSASQKLNRRVEIFGSYFESVVYRSVFGRIVSKRGVSLRQYEVVVAALEKYHSWSLLNNFHAEKFVVEFSAALEIRARQAKVNDASGSDHDNLLPAREPASIAGIRSHAIKIPKKKCGTDS
jgi:hypothetical protein